MSQQTFAGKNEHHARFNDLGDEPLCTLSPISGYENQPIVPLKKAVQPICHVLCFHWPICLDCEKKLCTSRRWLNSRRIIDLIKQTKKQIDS